MSGRFSHGSLFLSLGDFGQFILIVYNQSLHAMPQSSVEPSQPPSKAMAFIQTQQEAENSIPRGLVSARVRQVKNREKTNAATKEQPAAVLRERENSRLG